MTDSSIIKKYNFSNIITQTDTEQTCGIVKQIIDSGNYFDNSPKYQTKENLFARSESVWLKYLFVSKENSFNILNPSTHL